MGRKAKAPPARPGSPLREAREAAGISVAEAARRLGCAESQVSRLELRADNPRWASVARAIEVLGLPLERFFAEAVITAAADRIRGRGGAPARPGRHA